MLKHWKCKDSQKLDALLNPYLKNNTQIIFQGGTPWVAEILNNVIVWMIPYCAQQLFGRFFSIWKENQLKVDSNELKVNWFQLKSFLVNI